MRLKGKGARPRHLAQAVGKTDSWISQILAGKRAPRLDAMIDRIADYLECAPSALFEDPDQAPPHHEAEAGVPHAPSRLKLAKTLDPITRQQGIIEYQQDIAVVALSHLKPLITALEALARREAARPADGRRTPGHRAGTPKHRRARSAVGR